MDTLTRTRSALTAVCMVGLEAVAAIGLAPFAALWALSGWCSGDGGAADPRACATAQQRANHTALIVLSIVLPVLLTLVTLLLRLVAGKAAGQLGWAKLTGLAT